MIKAQSSKETIIRTSRLIGLQFNAIVFLNKKRHALLSLWQLDCLIFMVSWN